MAHDRHLQQLQQKRGVAWLQAATSHEIANGNWKKCGQIAQFRILRANLIAARARPDGGKLVKLEFEPGWLFAEPNLEAFSYTAGFARNLLRISLENVEQPRDRLKGEHAKGATLTCRVQHEQPDIRTDIEYSITIFQLDAVLKIATTFEYLQIWIT